MDLHYYENVAEQRRRLGPASAETSAALHLPVTSNLVLSWMADPGNHLADAARLFATIPAPHELEGLSFATLPLDLLLFMTICQRGNPALIDRLAAELSPELQLLGALHDDAEIGGKFAFALGGAALAGVMRAMEKNRLGVRDVLSAVETAVSEPRIAPAMARGLQVLRLHDPDRNGFSSLIKRFGRIRTSRVLYFSIPRPDAWPELAATLQARSADEVESAWYDLCYEPPAATHFCYHIEATVLRIIFLALSFQGRSADVETWKAVRLSADSPSCGHDGSSKGFDTDTLKMLDALQGDATWIALGKG